MKKSPTWWKKTYRAGNTMGRRSPSAAYAAACFVRHPLRGSDAAGVSVLWRAPALRSAVSAARRIYTPALTPCASRELAEAGCRYPESMWKITRRFVFLLEKYGGIAWRYVDRRRMRRHSTAGASPARS